MSELWTVDRVCPSCGIESTAIVEELDPRDVAPFADTSAVGVTESYDLKRVPCRCAIRVVYWLE
jgi:hypothetical protein